MKDKLYIKTRLDNLLAEKIPVADEYIIPHNARIKTIQWIYNEGDIQPESNIRIRLRNIEEELIMLDFTNDTSMTRKIAEAKKSEIECILN